VVFGGGIIPDADRPALYEAGMRAIFGPGTSTETISAFVAEASGRDDSGVGASGGWVWEA
jgi:methylmalonyl-CoA mutase C-terminal domain/subunit